MWIRGGQRGDYKDVPFDILVDSPVYAGRYTKKIDLTPAGSNVSVRLRIVADDAKFLETKPEQVKEHKAMVEQALKLFGAQHYDHYDFLFSLSDRMGGNGLEHQRSSENGVAPTTSPSGNRRPVSPTCWRTNTPTLERQVPPRRRPVDAEFNVPMQDSLLWVYEGQTQYWGNVLAARAACAAGASIDALAWSRPPTRKPPGAGLAQLQDTTNDPIIASRAPRATAIGN